MNKNKPIKVGLLVGEFFSSSLPFCQGKGGYGMIARHYITEYIPNTRIEIDTICGYNDKPELLTHLVDERKKVLFLPNVLKHLPQKAIIRHLLFKIDNTAKQKIRSVIDEYDLFLSIEFSHIAYDVLSLASKGQKLILWVQDPRTKQDWVELDTLSKIKQNGYRPKQKFAKLLNQLHLENRLKLISQGHNLMEKAREIYQLPAIPIDFIPNPIQIPDPESIDFNEKKAQIVFLGRLDSVKRPWLIGEVAKKMPEYDFYFLGHCHEQSMNQIMAPYRNIPNCHFLGHVEGEKKEQLLRESMILINTSIHEAVPVSFLEALAYGLLIVSNRNPDNLTSKFGYYTQQINGNGYDGIDEFIRGIQMIMKNKTAYIEKAQEGMAYIKATHSIEKFQHDIRDLIINEYDGVVK